MVSCISCLETVIVCMTSVVSESRGRHLSQNVVHNLIYCDFHMRDQYIAISEADRSSAHELHKQSHKVSGNDRGCSIHSSPFSEPFSVSDVHQ
jgi:hypothetical protein